MILLIPVIRGGVLWSRGVIFHSYSAVQLCVHPSVCQSFDIWLSCTNFRSVAIQLPVWKLLCIFKYLWYGAKFFCYRFLSNFKLQTLDIWYASLIRGPWYCPLSVLWLASFQVGFSRLAVENSFLVDFGSVLKSYFNFWLVWIMVEFFLNVIKSKQHSITGSDCLLLFLYLIDILFLYFVDSSVDSTTNDLDFVK